VPKKARVELYRLLPLPTMIWVCGVFSDLPLAGWIAFTYLCGCCKKFVFDLKFLAIGPGSDAP